MIFVTVGTQLPFDRLIRAVDGIAPGLSVPVFAQVGETRFAPRNIRWQKLVGPVEFNGIMRDADVILSHAGIGTVLMAQKHGKPVILFPRNAALGEHRNDHQLATADALEGRPGVYIARTAGELEALLHARLDPPVSAGPHPGRDRLGAFVAGYIRRTHQQGRVPGGAAALDDAGRTLDHADAAPPARGSSGHRGGGRA